MALVNVLNLEGPQDEILSLRAIRHENRLLIADILEPDGTMPAIVIVTPITLGWLRQHCRHVLDQYPSWLDEYRDDEDANRYLERAFPYAVKPGQ